MKTSNAPYGVEMKDPFDMIIFGGLGDLSRRKLLPAMYRAFREQDMPEGSRLFLCSRKPYTQEQLQQEVTESLKARLKSSEQVDEDMQAFYNCLVPTQIDLLDIEQGWDTFKAKVDEHQRVRVYYLAVMPSAYGSCCQFLNEKGLITADSRLVVEKPLGYNLESAEVINTTMAEYFDESQIYRIDHYLGKETVKNLITLRFSNFLFEDVWDNKSIDHIQISISEQVGLEGRADFYDDVGALRDMVQNHLLQLLCLIALDSPNELTSDAVRLEKIKVLKSLQPIVGDNVDKVAVRGQYVSGIVNNNKIAGYLDELDDYESSTETFVALKTYVNSWRWAGVPFYIRTGKSLKHRKAEITIQFKDVTHNVYRKDQQKLLPNQLIINLQPEESIQLKLMANDVGGGTNTIEPITLNLDFNKDDDYPIRTSYQRLLLDVIRGDSTLFIHREEVIAAWKWIDPIVEHWKNSSKPPHLYSAGSWGPDEANEIFDHPHQFWHDLCE